MDALTIHNAETVVVAVSEDGELLKNELLAEARDITVVDDEFSADCAAAQIRRIRTLLAGVEASRKLVKKPVLDLGKRIDSLADAYSADLDAEVRRLNKLLNDHLAHQRELAAAEERRRIEAERQAAEEKRKAEAELRRLEEEKRKAQEAVMAPFTPEEKVEAQAKIVEIQTRQLELTAAPPPAPVQKAPITVAKPAGVAAQPVWRFEVTDVLALADHSVLFVRIEPNTAEILKAIRGGMRECPGLRIYSEHATIVR